MAQAIKGYFGSEWTDKSKAVFAMYINEREAHRAVKALESNGFSSEDISLLAPNRDGHHDFVYRQHQNVKEGALTGAALGFFILGLIGLLFGFDDSGVDANLYFYQTDLPNWVFTSLLGSFLGLIFGAAIGALVGIGTTQTAARRYGFYLKEGGIVLMVHIKNEHDRLTAKQILEKTRGQDIDVLDESKIWSIIIPEKNRPSDHLHL